MNHKSLIMGASLALVLAATGPTWATDYSKDADEYEDQYKHEEDATDDEDGRKAYCPAKSEDKCEDVDGSYNPDKKTCTVKYKTTEFCKKDDKKFVAIVLHKIVWTKEHDDYSKYHDYGKDGKKDGYGKCEKEEKEKIIKCLKKVDHYGKKVFKLVKNEKCEEACAPEAPAPEAPKPPKHYYN